MARLYGGAVFESIRSAEEHLLERRPPRHAPRPDGSIYLISILGLLRIMPEQKRVSNQFSDARNP